jgi:ribosome-binding factor A
MDPDKRSREYWKNLSGVPGPGDAGPADTGPGGTGRGRGRRTDRKTLQLCGQVADTLNYVLSGECYDDVLRNVYVVKVEPAPDASQLLVTVAPYDPNDPAPLDVILARLGHASGLLRREVAATISRRKAPQLLFRVLNPEAVLGEEGRRSPASEAGGGDAPDGPNGDS